MTTRLLMVLGLIVLLLGVPGCSNSSNDDQTITIDVPFEDFEKQQDITRAITLSIGETLKLSLASNKSTPYEWTADMAIGDPTIVQQTNHEYVSGSHPPGNTGGAGGNEIWTFKALKSGTTTIATEYTYLFEPTDNMSKVMYTFTANIAVQ